MYIPAPFAAKDRAELVALMRAHPFATLVTVAADGAPVANHLPFIVEAGEGGEGLVLLAHMARANPQWKRLDGEALVIFHGPHGYVSPSWYVEEAQDTRVPTWNYAAVHAYGRVRLLDDGGLTGLLERLVAANEAGRPAPWTVNMSSPARQARLRAIVGFAVNVTRLEGKLKISQNRAPADRGRVAEVMAAGSHPDEQELAALMARR